MKFTGQNSGYQQIVVYLLIEWKENYIYSTIITLKIIVTLKSKKLK